MFLHLGQEIFQSSRNSFNALSSVVSFTLPKQQQATLNYIPYLGVDLLLTSRKIAWYCKICDYRRLGCWWKLPVMLSGVVCGYPGSWCLTVGLSCRAWGKLAMHNTARNNQTWAQSRAGPCDLPAHRLTTGSGLILSKSGSCLLLENVWT